MNKNNFKSLISLSLLLIVMLSSCQAIGDIFKAGMWVGIIFVIIILAIVFWIIRKVSNK